MLQLVRDEARLPHKRGHAEEAEHEQPGLIVKHQGGGRLDNTVRIKRDRVEPRVGDEENLKRDASQTRREKFNRLERISHWVISLPSHNVRGSLGFRFP